MEESIIQIVFYMNEYYLYDGYSFYGPYHSMADAESDVKSKWKRKVNLPTGYKFIKNIAW